MPDAFDLIMKTAEQYALENNQLTFRSLMQGFGFENHQMAMTLLKFINEMLAKSMEDEKRQAKFLAKLEGIGIKEILEKWHMADNIDIHDQIQSYQYYSNNITDSIIYKLEVHKNRVRDLEAHKRVLEAKVE